MLDNLDFVWFIMGIVSCAALTLTVFAGFRYAHSRDSAMIFLALIAVGMAGDALVDGITEMLFKGKDIPVNYWILNSFFSIVPLIGMSGYAIKLCRSPSLLRIPLIILATILCVTSASGGSYGQFSKAHILVGIVWLINLLAMIVHALVKFKLYRERKIRIIACGFAVMILWIAIPSLLLNEEGYQYLASIGFFGLSLFFLLIAFGVAHLDDLFQIIKNQQKTIDEKTAALEKEKKN